MLTIKEFIWEEVDQYLALYQKVFTLPPWNDTDSDEAVLNYFRSLYEMNTFTAYGLVKDNLLVGLSLGFLKPWQHGTEYSIEQFCIDNDTHGKGFGSQFLSLLKEAVKERKVTHIILTTNIDVPAYDFYQKNGYRVLEVSRLLAINV